MTLRAKATPGPWQPQRASSRYVVTAGSLVVATAAPQIVGAEREANAAYIAAANPKAILALLDVADAACRYFNGYVQDEAADGEMLDKGWSDDRLYSGCSRQQAIDAFALRAALAALGEGK